VRVPLYPGHGLTPAAFFKSTADEWIGSARDALAALREKTDIVSIVGLSMGAAIAAILAADDNALRSIVLIAPYLRIPNWVRLALPLRRLWSPFVGDVEARHPRSIQDPEEREKSLAYGVVNARAMAELAKVARRGSRALPRVTAPTLVIQSREDPRVSKSTARMALKESGAREKRLVWTKTGGHVITVDFGKDQVLAETLNWIRRLGGQPGGTRLPEER
jgi:carboxylesterase